MSSYVNNPDYTPVVLRKSVKDFTKKEQTEKFGETVLRPTSTKTNKTTSHTTSSAKMDDPDYKPKVVTSEMAKKIIAGRSAKKLNQEQLAQKCNLSVSIIKSIEKPTSTTVYNSVNMQKIARVLEISFK